MALPRFALQVGTAQETYTVGDTIPIHVHATNLMNTEAEDLTITVTARYASQLQAFEDVRSLQLSSLGKGNFEVQWDTTGLLAGTYTLSAQGQDQAGQRDLATIHVQLQQKPRQRLFLPLVMNRVEER